MHPVKHLLVALAAAAASTLAVAPAGATEGVAYRIASNTVCVQALTATTDWDVQCAIDKWNGTGLVNLQLQPVCDQSQAHITLRVYRSTTDALAGESSTVRTWGSGAWSSDGLTWLYKGADVTLNNVAKRRMEPSQRPCWSRYIVAHELGHALGLPHNDSRQSVMSYVYKRVSLCQKTLRLIDVRNLTALHIEEH